MTTAYESVVTIPSEVVKGVTFTVAKMSYGRRIELMRCVRELAKKSEFLSASENPEDKMDAALLEAEINRSYLRWGLLAISGLTLDGAEATPESLLEHGPEDLFREALSLIRAQTGLTETERKN
jgi:hypothetical protein